MNFNLDIKKFCDPAAPYPTEAKKAVLKRAVGGYVRDHSLLEWIDILAYATPLGDDALKAKAEKMVAERIKMGGNSSISERWDDAKAKIKKLPGMEHLLGWF